MPDGKLKAIKFQRQHVDLFKNFKCGSLPHETPLAEWIRTESLTALKYSKVKIWFYMTDDTPPLDPKNLVGYGSVNLDEFLGEGDDGKPQPIKVFTIPTFAIDENFWGKPKTDDSEEKYSRQIIRHLQHEAKEWLRRSTSPPESLLFLVVHPDAKLAQKLYADCGFATLPMTFRDKRTGVDCPRMVYRLN